MSDAVENSAGSKRLTGLRRFLLGFAPFAGVALIWVLMVHVGGVRAVFLPPLEQMPGILWRMFAVERIVPDIVISCYRVFLGFAVAVLFATPLGVLMGYSRRMHQMFTPIVGFVRYMPVPVFIPLCILWFGSGNLEKIVIIVLGAFFQLVLMVADAATAVQREYYEAATMLGAPRRDLVLRVLWPAALPQIFDAYRTCMGWAWTYLVVAEIVGATTGIGYYIIKAQRYLMVPQIFGAMLLIGILGMATDLVFGVLHSWLFPWAGKSRGFLS